MADRTLVVRSRLLDELVGARVSLKAESLQRTGSFKFRGAYNRIASIPAAERQTGVLAFSSGNHAQAVALAARLLGTSSTIVMPADAPSIKLEATRRYGAKVITYDRYSEDREQIGLQIARQRGLTLVRPFDDPLVIAGQGAAALELVEDSSHRDRRSHHDRRRVTGDDAGELTFGINRELLDRIVTVSDADLVDAMRFAFEHLKLVLAGRAKRTRGGRADPRSLRD